MAGSASASEDELFFDPADGKLSYYKTDTSLLTAYLDLFDALLIALLTELKETDKVTFAGGKITAIEKVETSTDIDISGAESLFDEILLTVTGNGDKSITIGNATVASLVIAAGKVNTGDITGDVEVTEGTVEIGAVTGNVEITTATAATIASITGDLAITEGEVEVVGTVGGNVTIDDGTVTTGDITGNLIVASATELNTGAVGGTFTTNIATDGNVVNTITGIPAEASPEDKAADTLVVNAGVIESGEIDGTAIAVTNAASGATNTEIDVLLALAEDVTVILAGDDPVLDGVIIAEGTTLVIDGVTATITAAGEGVLEVEGTLIVGDTTGDAVEITGATLTAGSDEETDADITLDGSADTIVFATDDDSSGSLAIATEGVVTIYGAGSVSVGIVLTLENTNTEGDNGTFTVADVGDAAGIAFQQSGTNIGTVTGTIDGTQGSVLTLGSNAQLTVEADASGDTGVALSIAVIDLPSNGTLEIVSGGIFLSDGTAGTGTTALGVEISGASSSANDKANEATAAALATAPKSVGLADGWISSTGNYDEGSTVEGGATITKDSVFTTSSHANEDDGGNSEGSGDDGKVIVGADLSS